MTYTKNPRGSALLIIVATIAMATVIVLITYQNIGQSNQLPLPAYTEAANDIRSAPQSKATTNDAEPKTTYNGRLIARAGVPIIEFNQTDYDNALEENKIVVLYFYANWCPLCKEEFPKMTQVFNSLSSDKLIGFRVNFNDSQTDDNEKELASEFGVAYQHTKVIIKNRERIMKSPETWTQDRYRQVINSLLE